MKTKLKWTKTAWGGWIAIDPVPMTNDRVLRISRIRTSYTGIGKGRLAFQVRGLDPSHTARILNPAFLTFREAERCTEEAIASAIDRLAKTGRANGRLK